MEKKKIKKNLENNSFRFQKSRIYYLNSFFFSSKFFSSLPTRCCCACLITSCCCCVSACCSNATGGGGCGRCCELPPFMLPPSFKGTCWPAVPGNSALWSVAGLRGLCALMLAPVADTGVAAELLLAFCWNEENKFWSLELFRGKGLI